MRTSIARRGLAGLVALAVCFVWLLPIWVVVVTALEPNLDVVTNGMAIVPAHITFANFQQAWELGGLGGYAKNSLVITAVSVPVGVLLAALGAFPLALRHFAGRRAVLLCLLLGLGVSPLVALFPLTQLMKTIHIGGSLWSLVPVYVAFGLPFQTLVLRGAFLGLPVELVEAARLDGARELWVWVRVAVPLVMPVIGAVSLLSAIGSWNEFTMALILINQESSRTLPLGLSDFQGEFSTNIAQITAGTIIAMLPMIVAFVVLRRYIVRGVAAGAVKF
jgi:raffinose/stachyose/melibiose transport system permease protein